MSNLSELYDEFEVDSLLRNQIDELIIPAIQFIRNEKEIHSKGCSFGGAPSLPDGEKWPEHNLGVYRPLLRVNFNNVPDLKCIFPDSGILQLYVADITSDHDQIIGDFVKGYYYNDDTELSLREFPKDVPFGRQVPANVRVNLPDEVLYGKAFSFDLSEIVSLPTNYHTSAIKEYPESQKQLVNDMACELLNDRDYMFGYPTTNSLSYDPLPDEDWMPLVTLRSDDELLWYWNDGERLVIMIKSQDLASGDFTNLRWEIG